MAIRENNSVNIAQSVAVLIDGNNIGKSIGSEFGTWCMLNYDIIIPKILQGRALNRLVYLREGVSISEKLTKRLKSNFFGIVEACHKSADIPLTIHAVKLAEKVDTIVIFSGDGDYLPLISYLKSVGIRVEVVAVKKAANKRIIEAADDIYFICKEDIFINPINNQNDNFTGN